MEDALAQDIQTRWIEPMFGSLNPCCNGRCTRTDGEVAVIHRESGVLILVVMEDALAQKELIRSNNYSRS